MFAKAKLLEMIKKVGITVKYNIFGYLIGEGFSNILKKKKSATSSIMIMCATMFMFGIFLLITENVNHFVEKI